MTDGPESPGNPSPDGPSPSTIWLGVATGVAPALVSALFFPTKSAFLMTPMILLSVASVSLWPLAAVVFACIRETRRFGLGMLIGVGLGWLALLAICGGMAARR